MLDVVLLKCPVASGPALPANTYPELSDFVVISEVGEGEVCVKRPLKLKGPECYELVELVGAEEARVIVDAEGEEFDLAGD